MSNETNWAKLEQLEFEKLGDVWDWASLGSALARESGLVVLQAHGDFHEYMKELSGRPDTAQRQARSVSRHLLKVANHLAGCKKEFESIPSSLMKAFEAEIRAARTKNKKRIDLASS